MNKAPDGISILAGHESAGDAMTPNPYRIRRVAKDTHDTFTIEIEPANGFQNPSYHPGQFNMLYVFGTGEIPISISGDPGESDRFSHTTRVAGTVTRALHNLKRGEMLGVRGPFGSHWPIEQARGKDVVLVAGGIGLAPLRPALLQLICERDRYRQIVLLYGARTPQDILYLKDLEKWKTRYGIDVYITVDRSTKDWRGHVGVVTTLLSGAPFDSSQAMAFVCGPEIMMRFTVMALLKRGMPSEKIFLSLERNMKCAVGFCGHCQYGPAFICKDGPVFSYERIAWLFSKREI